MKHIVMSETADLFTRNDLAAFVRNIIQDTDGPLTETAIAIADGLIRNGWVSVVRIDTAPAP